MNAPHARPYVKWKDPAAYYRPSRSERARNVAGFAVEVLFLAVMIFGGIFLACLMAPLP